MIKIIIADDHKILLDGLSLLLNQSKNFNILALCSDGKQVVEAIETEKPDVVLLDINMPIMDGTETLKYIKKYDSNIKVLVLTTYDESGVVTRMLANGANGYLLKNSAAEKLVNAIQQVMQGQTVIDPEIAIKLLDDTRFSENLPRLTRREQEILEQIAKGHNTQTIADNLFISVNTVLTHKKNLFEKMAVTSAPALVKKALDLGFL